MKYTKNIIGSFRGDDVYEIKLFTDSSMELFKHQGIAIEAQNFPDAINHKGFGKVILKKGGEFKSQTTYSIERL